MFGRRLAVIPLVALLGGCADAFRGHQDVVARAAGQELSVERLATLLAPAKQVPLRREVFDRVAEVWVDYQLLAQAVAAGDSLLDSATIERANWPVVAQVLANYLHDSLIGARATPTTAQVDSAYAAGNHRYLYHILFRVRQDTTDAVKAAKRRQAEGALAQVRRGASFEEIARRLSEDPGSGPRGGLLGLVGRQAMVKPFEDAAFALDAGQFSDVVETAFGYHVIWRPALDRVRDSFAMELEQIVVNALDSVYLDSLSNKTDIRVRGSAPAMVRRAAEDLRAAKRRSRVVATFRGGRLRERDFAMWLQAFPPQTRSMVAQAPDSTLTEFVRSIARNEMLVAAARERGLQLNAEDRDSIRSAYRRDLHGMLDGMGVSTDSLAADSAAGQDRATVAARHVDAYFTAITSPNAQRRYYEVPPFLADVLRSRADWVINQSGLDRAMDRARVLRGPEVPSAPVPQMTPAPRLEPAPGGPPVPPGGN